MGAYPHDSNQNWACSNTGWGSALYFGGVALFLFLLVVGCLAFYEIQQLSELKSITLMVVNMVVYAGIIGGLCLSSYGIIVPNGWGDSV